MEGAPRIPPASLRPSVPPLRQGLPSLRGFGMSRGIPAGHLRAHRGGILFLAAAGSGATSGRNSGGDAGLPRSPKGDGV